MPQTTEGRYSRFLPKADRLRELYETARGDEKLADLDEELSIVQGLIFEEFERLEGTVDYDAMLKLIARARLELAESPPAEADVIDSGVLDQGSLGDYAVLKPRLRQRYGLFWTSCRLWYAPAKLAGMNFIKAAKNSLDERALSLITADLLKVYGMTLETFSGTITAPSSRDANFKGNEHFASALAERLAAATGNEYRRIFAPTPADRKGHHPMREKERPELAEGVKVDGERILLVDDVSSSGITIETHIRALREAGAKVNALVWVCGETSGTGR